MASNDRSRVRLNYHCSTPSFTGNTKHRNELRTFSSQEEGHILRQSSKVRIHVRLLAVLNFLGSTLAANWTSFALTKLELLQKMAWMSWDCELCIGQL